jgi:hypothetical protein
MAVLLRYYHLVPAFIHEAQTRARAGDTTPDPTMMRKAIELPDKPRAGCRLLGAYVPHGMAAGESHPTQPAVMHIDTADPADLNFVSTYYAGFISFAGRVPKRWVPRGGNEKRP